MTRIYTATLLTVLGTIFPALSHGAQWQEIGGSKSAVVSADISTIKRTGNVVEVWVLFDFKTPQTEAGPAFLSTKERKLNNCSTLETAKVADIVYSGSGGSGKVIFQRNKPAVYEAVKSGSVADGILQFACSFNSNYIAEIDSAPQSLPTEFCGNTTKALPKHKLVQWDCSSVRVNNIAELEDQVSKTHFIPDELKGTKHKVYESTEPKFSAWVFHDGNKAARFRAIFVGNSYQGIGVTTFCADTEEACVAFEEFSGAVIPDPLLFKLLPPAPTAPPIIN